MPESFAPTLSYEDDIAPLQRRFFQRAFQNPNLSPEAAAGISMRASAGLNDAYVGQAKAREVDETRRARELQFQSAKFQFDKAREDASRERGLLESLIPLQKELDSVLNDTASDPDTRQKNLAQIGIRYAGPAAQSPAISNALRSAAAGIVGEKKRKLTAGKLLESGADPALLDSYAKKSGAALDYDTEITFAEASSILSNSGARKAQREAQAAEEKYARRETRDRINSNLDGILKGVSGLKLAEDYQGRPNPNAFAAGQEQPIDAFLSVFAPDKKEEIKKLSPAEQIKRVTELQASLITSGSLGPVAGRKPTGSSFFD